MRICRGYLGRGDGFSVTEATIMLTVLSIFTGLAAPSVHDYVAQAKMIKAQHDVQTISVTLGRFTAVVATTGSSR